MKISGLLFFFIVVFGSCINKGGQVEERQFYSNGRLKSHLVLTNEHQMNGTLLEYYSTGELRKQTSLANGEINGEMKTYYKNGQLKLIQHFDHGIHTKTDFWYYPNGKIEAFVPYLEDKKNGISQSFYLNGRSKDFAIYFDGKLKFAVKYSEDTILSELGFFPWAWSRNSDELNLTDTFELSISAAIPPHIEEHTLVISINDSIVDQQRNFFAIDSISMYTFRECLGKGVHNIKFRLEHPYIHDRNIACYEHTFPVKVNPLVPAD